MKLIYKGYDDKLNKFVTNTYSDIEDLKRYIKAHYEKKKIHRETHKYHRYTKIRGDIVDYGK